MPRTRSNGADVEVILNPPESTQAFRVVRGGWIQPAAEICGRLTTETAHQPTATSRRAKSRWLRSQRVGGASKCSRRRSGAYDLLTARRLARPIRWGPCRDNWLAPRSLAARLI